MFQAGQELRFQWGIEINTLALLTECGQKFHHACMANMPLNKQGRQSPVRTWPYNTLGSTFPLDTS